MSDAMAERRRLRCERSEPERSVTIHFVGYYSLSSQRLCLCSGSKLRRNRTDKQRFKSKLEKNRPNLAQAQGRPIELEIYKIVVGIYFVMKACNWLELKIQLQDFVQVAQTSRIHFQFDHNSREGSEAVVLAQFFSASLVCARRKAAIKEVHRKE
jgi:hypothetical protein